MLRFRRRVEWQTYTSSHIHFQRGSGSPCNGRSNRLRWHRRNWFPMAARSIYCHKHWTLVTSCWHGTQSLLLVCIFSLPIRLPFPWHKGGEREREDGRKQGLRGCPAGYMASSPRFNVNLILSLEMLLSARLTRRREEKLCNLRLPLHTQTHTRAVAPTYQNRIKQMQGRPSPFRWRWLERKVAAVAAVAVAAAPAAATPPPSMRSTTAGVNSGRHKHSHSKLNIRTLPVSQAAAEGVWKYLKLKKKNGGGKKTSSTDEDAIMTRLVQVPLTGWISRLFAIVTHLK